MVEAVKQNESSSHHAAPVHKANLIVLEAAAKQEEHALHRAAPEHKAERIVLDAAVKLKEYALQHGASGRPAASHAHAAP